MGAGFGVAERKGRRGGEARRVKAPSFPPQPRQSLSQSVCDCNQQEGAVCIKQSRQGKEGGKKRITGCAICKIYVKIANNNKKQLSFLFFISASPCYSFPQGQRSGMEQGTSTSPSLCLHQPDYCTQILPSSSSAISLLYY